MIYLFLDYELDTHSYELRGLSGRIPLEPQVYDVLTYLIQQRDRMVPKLELMERLWPDRYVSDGALSHCIMLARKAVGDSGRAQHCIRTIHRRGYRFVAKLRRHATGLDEAAGERTARGSVPGAKPAYQPLS